MKLLDPAPILSPPAGRPLAPTTVRVAGSLRSEDDVGSFRLAPGPRPPRDAGGSPLGRILLGCLAPLGLFLLLALWGIGGPFPPGLNHDAAWHGRYALRILAGTEPFAVFTPECWGQENLFSYTLAGFFWLFGAGKTQIELHATLWGALGVLSFYALVYDLERSVRRSVFCALLFAVSGALVLYSRVGWRLITLAPVVCWIVLAAFRCLREPRRAHAALLGLLVGISFYTYLQARVLVVFLGAFWLIRILGRPTWSERRAECRLAAVSLGTYGLVALPMWVYAAQHFAAWNGRAAFFLSRVGWRDLWPNLWQCLEFFDRSGQGDDFYIGVPVLEGACHGLWILGLGLTLMRWRKAWPLLLLFGFLLLPTAITRPNFQRAFGVLPVVYLFIVQAALWLGDQLRAWQLPRIGAGRSARLVAALAFALVGAQTASTWEKLYVRRELFAWGFYPGATAVGRYLGEHRAEGVYAVCAKNFPEDILRFMRNPTPEPDRAPFQNYTQAARPPGADSVADLLADLDEGRLDVTRRVLAGELEPEFVRKIRGAGFKLSALEVIRDATGREAAHVYALRPPGVPGLVDEDDQLPP